jgi:hypothetical protein
MPEKRVEIEISSRHALRLELSGTCGFPPFDSTLWPRVPATQYPGMMHRLFSPGAHFLKTSEESPPWSIPGVANRTMGPGCAREGWMDWCGIVSEKELNVEILILGTDVGGRAR